MPVIKYLVVGILLCCGIEVVPTQFLPWHWAHVADVLHCFLHFLGDILLASSLCLFVEELAHTHTRMHTCTTTYRGGLLQILTHTCTLIVTVNIWLYKIYAYM